MNRKRAIVMPLLFLGGLSILPSHALAGDDGGEIHYRFARIIVPGETPSGELIIPEDSRWMSLTAYPTHVAQIQRSLVVHDREFERPLATGDVVYLADSDHVYGCMAKIKPWNDYGETVPCFADMDRDGAFDAFYMKKIDPTFDPYPHVQDVEDMSPIEPIPYVQTASIAEFEALRLGSPYYLAQKDSRIHVCLGKEPNPDYLLCINETARIQRSKNVQRVELLGGIFWVQRLQNDQISIRIEKAVDPIAL